MKKDTEFGSGIAEVHNSLSLFTRRFRCGDCNGVCKCRSFCLAGMDLIFKIIMDFNDMFRNINWNDVDNVRRRIIEIPAMVSSAEKYHNAMRNSDEQSVRLESERTLQQVIFSIMADNMELFKQFQDNPFFKKWLSDLVFSLT